MRRPEAAAAAAAAGRFAEALALLAPGPSPDYRMPERDPRQDLQYGESLALACDPAPYLAVRRRLAARPSSPVVELLRGVTDVFLGRFRPAEKALGRALRSRRLSGQAYAWRGVARSLEARRHKRQDGLRPALADLDRAVEAGAGELALPWRAELRHDLEDAAGALADIERVLASRPGDRWARVEKGELLCEAGRVAQALALFDELSREHPDQAWAWALRGRTLATSGREAEGLADLARAVRLSSRSAAYRAWLAEALRRLGRYEAAAAELDEAIRLEPGYVLAWIWRGRIRLVQGRLENALADLERAVRLDPRYRLAFAWRGEALFKLGRRRRAKADFEKVRPLDLRRTWNPRCEEGTPVTALSRERAWARDLRPAEAA